MFEAEISKLSARAGKDAFAPHVTLLGDLATAPGTTLSVCRTHFFKFGPIRAEVAGLTKTNAYYMSVFLDLTLFPGIDDALARVQHDLGEIPDLSLRPHLSLAYGLAPEALTAAETRVLQERFRGMVFELDRIAIVSAARGVPEARWTEICATALD